MTPEDVAEWLEWISNLPEPSAQVDLRAHATAIRQLIASEARLRTALEDAAEALATFVDTDTKYREPYETPLSAYDRARAALEHKP